MQHSGAFTKVILLSQQTMHCSSRIAEDRKFSWICPHPALPGALCEDPTLSMDSLTKCLQAVVLTSHRYGWVGAQTCGLVNLWLSWLIIFHRYMLFLPSFKSGTPSKWRFLLSIYWKYSQPSNLLKHTFVLLLTKSLTVTRQLRPLFITTVACNFLIITLCSSHLLLPCPLKALSWHLFVTKEIYLHRHTCRFLYYE